MVHHGMLFHQNENKWFNSNRSWMNRIIYQDESTSCDLSILPRAKLLLVVVVEMQRWSWPLISINVSNNRVALAGAVIEFIKFEILVDTYWERYSDRHLTHLLLLHTIIDKHLGPLQFTDSSGMHLTYKVTAKGQRSTETEFWTFHLI